MTVLLLGTRFYEQYRFFKANALMLILQMPMNSKPRFLGLGLLFAFCIAFARAALC